jgi:hypothetical protein
MIPNGLKIVEIYENLDGPKLFLVKSKTGRLYLVYWCGCGEDYDEWLYVSVDLSMIYRLKHKVYDIYNACIAPGVHKFLIKTTVNGDLIDFGVEREHLPPPNHFIEHVDKQASIFERD